MASCGSRHKMKAGNAADRLWTQQKQVIQKKVGE